MPVVLPISEPDTFKQETDPLGRLRANIRAAGERAAHLFRFPASHPDNESAKLLWLVRLRWLAIALFFGLAAPALVAGLLNSETVPKFLGVIGILFIFNLITQLKFSEDQHAVLPIWICFQMAFDLAMLTILLALTGGFSNPFVFLFLLNASLGGLLIASRLSVPFLFLNHIALGILQFQFFIANRNDASPQMFATFAIYQFAIFAFWIVMRSLGGHLERQFELQSKTRLLIEKQDRLRAIGSLAAGFSHEFASPLNSAKIRLQRIVRKQQTEDATEALDAVLECESVVRQMNSSQLDARDFQFKQVIIADLLNDIIETWQAEHPGSKVIPTYLGSTEGSLPPINFAQVVLNLLDNAIDASVESDIELLFDASAEGYFVMKISDCGPGFPASVLKHLGEPFVTTKANGTGLGLYVSQLFCQSLGGTLKVENRENGMGAVVQLEWPKSGGRA